MEKQSAEKLREQLASVQKEMSEGEIANLKNEMQQLEKKLTDASEKEKLQTEALKSVTLQKK